MVLYGASGQQSIGFVTPTKGDYQIRITDSSAFGGPYTLRTQRQTPSERMSGVPPVTPVVRFHSPRIAELSEDVKVRQPGAIERFWSEAEARGAPLVETIDGDDRNFLVTFLWREAYEIRNVRVVWPGAAPLDYYMSHIPKTDVWYKTLRIHRGSRFSYELAPNDRPGEPDYSAQADPLNSRQYGGHSIVETPGAPDESWYLRTPSVRGSITQRSLDSALLKRRREISVYTPPGYSPSSGPYPLLILFDGGAYLRDDLINAPNTLNNLIAAHRIRPPVVCFVSDNRGVGLGQTQVYASAMATELVPWLRSSYAISADSKDVVIGGYSAGAGAAGYAAFNYPSVFGSALLQSGAGQVLVPLLVNSPQKPLRFYIDQGLYEYGNWSSLSPDEQAVDGWFEEGIAPQGQNWLLRARLFRTILQAKGYDFEYRETGGGHEVVHWRATLAEGLIALLGQNRNKH